MAGITAAPAWGGAPLSVVATTTDLRSLVEVVGGDRVAVDALVSPGQDPHGVDIKPGQLVALKRGVHVHGFGNPHYWLDPENARPITAGILEALARLAPADRGYFERRRSDFLVRLDTGLARWQAALAPYRGIRIVVVHESWPYFARRFGLEIVAAVEPTPGVPPSPASLAALTRQMKEAQVRVIIAEPYSDAALVQRVAALGGAREVQLAASVGALPEARDYLALFDVDVARLADALRSP